VEKYSDKAILIGIKNRKDYILEYLYTEYFPHVQRIVLKNEGNEQDARDLFQEALIIIFTRLKGGDLTIKTSFHSFFIALCRFIWFREKGISSPYQEKIVDESHQQDQSVDIVEEIHGEKAYMEYHGNRNEKIFQRNYRKLRRDCKRVLKMFFKKKSFDEITSRMKYTNEQYARRKKYLCMQSLMKMINDDPEYIEAVKNKNL
jgi:DNA-directed RNA polymerase specialized sigma24 family protein